MPATTRVIEVAETSLAYDRSTKRRLYAAAGIAEYWVVDTVAEAIEVHREPGPDGFRAVSRVAGGDAATLTGPLATTLVAISAGAVFMGANTYIGNAPNFMVKSIAESRGVRMPSFFGYLGWSLLVLGPVYGLLTLLFFL